MKFRKKIDIAKSDLKIDHQSNIMLFGSCFSENIGEKLLDNKFGVDVNPFGVLYNPASICQAIDLLQDEKIFSEADIVEQQGVCHTFFHHSEFSDTDRSNFLQNINQRRKESSDNLNKAGILLITFGTAYVFNYKETGQVVANCHKFPASEFERYRLTADGIVGMWSRLIGRLRKTNPSLQILFTVSPIRHWKDGAHNNQLSKAILLLAIDELIGRHSGLHYFPSYEIVLDELRDYRFFAEDMLHPNSTAIEYIWEIFSDTYFDEKTKQINKEWQTIRKAIGHRPFNPDTEDHKHFLRQTLLKINELQKKYSYFDVEKEVDFLTQKLMNQSRE